MTVAAFASHFLLNYITKDKRLVFFFLAQGYLVLYIAKIVWRASPPPLLPPTASAPVPLPSNTPTSILRTLGFHFNVHIRSYADHVCVVHFPKRRMVARLGLKVLETCGLHLSKNTTC